MRSGTSKKGRRVLPFSAALQPAACRLTVARVQVNADVASTQNLGGQKRTAAAAEWVKHDFATACECFNDRLERPHRLLGGVQDVAGVFTPLTIQSMVEPRSRRPKDRPPGIRVYRIIYSRFPSNLKTAYNLLMLGWSGCRDLNSGPLVLPSKLLSLTYRWCALKTQGLG